jgi:uncharacterized protein
MKAVFADTFYYLALVSRNDRAQTRAVALPQQLRAATVTTAWVLTEVADALADPRQRPAFCVLLESLRADSKLTIVPASQSLFDLGVGPFERRVDKEWSLTDCISFVVMEQTQLSDTLTGDHHFEHAGFRTLFPKT